MEGFLRSKKLVYGLMAVNLVFIGIIAYLILQKPNKTESMAAQQQRYPLLSKRIFTENQNDLLINFVALRTVLREYTDMTKDSIGLYFEYLPTGTSIGINDRQEFAQASLVKVPVAMAVLKQVEDGKLELDQKLTLKQEHIDEGFGELWRRGAGAQLTVNEALEASLTQSDNTAAKLLIDSLPLGTADQVFDALDIPKDIEGDSPLITPKSYISIFRSLYLASYVNRDNSNKLLDLLTKTEFNDRIKAGVPDEVPVAHKIGVFDTASEGLDEEVHSDCGIIYIPNRPYALCVMTQGEDEIQAKTHMKNLSQLIYGYVSEVQ